MILVNKANGGAITENISADELEFGVIPKLPAGEYAVYEPDGSPVWNHREIVERWVRYPYIFRVEQ